MNVLKHEAILCKLRVRQTQKYECVIIKVQKFLLKFLAAVRTKICTIEHFMLFTANRRIRTTLMLPPLYILTAVLTSATIYLKRCVFRLPLTIVLLLFEGENTKCIYSRYLAQARQYLVLNTSRSSYFGDLR